MEATLLEEVQHSTASERLRSQMSAVRVEFTWLGITKSLSTEQKSLAASAFNADSATISASKRLLDLKHPALAALTKLKGDVIKYWKDQSLPFPENGIRLIGRQKINEFDIKMAEYRSAIDDAVFELEQHYAEMREAARNRLGSLYNASDYPITLIGAFSIDHSFPNVEVPEYLRSLNPSVYRQECERVKAQFSEAVAMTEQMFHQQFSELVEHLTERLTPDENGKQKTFRDSTIENLQEFFERFQHLNIGSSQELEELVNTAHLIIRGIEPKSLRENQSIRESIVSKMSRVKTRLVELVIDQPRRNILRRPK